MTTESGRGRRGPRVFVPPPLIFIVTLIAGIAIDRYVTDWSIPVAQGWRNALASIVAAAGVIVIGAALGLFRKAGTRPEPWQPSTSLVTGGIYRFTRNPMYLGMALLYAGFAVLFSSVAALLLLAPLIVLIHVGVIAREERYLAEIFGDEYRRYRSRVRPWL
jgi:protein-S-isoprenylcysteine O-methyltransferase Ste14